MKRLYGCNNQRTREATHLCNQKTLNTLEQGTLLSVSESQSQDLCCGYFDKEIIYNGKQRNWNSPMLGEGPGSGSTGLEQIGTEPSQVATHDGIIDRSASPYMNRNQNDYSRVGLTPQDQMSSRLSQRDDESFIVPHHITNSAPRMIQQGNHGKTFSQNAFRRLKNMSNAGEPPEKLPALPPPGDLGPYGYPTTKAEAKKPEKKYPGTKEYHMTRCFCCWTTFLIVFLVCCALGTGALALFKMEKGCEPVSATLVVTDVIASVIAVLEWIRLWIWREPLTIRQKPSLRHAGKEGVSPMSSMGPAHGSSNLPAMTIEPSPLHNTTAYCPRANNTGSAGGFLTQGFQQRLYDVPQFVSALFLILLYFAGTLCVVGTITASAIKLSKCSLLATTALGFSAVLAILIVMRLIMCCMSDACHGVIYRTAMATASANDPVPIVAVNQLHQVLPGLGKQMAPTGEVAIGAQQPTAWLMNLANASDPRQQLSIVQPMPAKFSNDFAQVS